MKISAYACCCGCLYAVTGRPGAVPDGDAASRRGGCLVPQTPRQADGGVETWRHGRAAGPDGFDSEGENCDFVNRTANLYPHHHTYLYVAAAVGAGCCSCTMFHVVGTLEIPGHHTLHTAVCVFSFRCDMNCGTRIAFHPFVHEPCSLLFDRSKEG